MPATEFTPLASTLGGMLGVSAVLLMAFNGRIAGISGILGRLFPSYVHADVAGASAFVAGMLAAPLLYVAFSGSPYAQLGWTQNELATRARINCRTIVNIENGKHHPNVTTINSIERAFNKAGLSFVSSDVDKRLRVTK